VCVINITVRKEDRERKKALFVYVGEWGVELREAG